MSVAELRQRISWGLLPIIFLVGFSRVQAAIQRKQPQKEKHSVVPAQVFTGAHDRGAWERAPD